MYPTVLLRLWKIYIKKEMEVKIGNNCSTNDGNSILSYYVLASALLEKQQQVWRQKGKGKQSNGDHNLKMEVAASSLGEKRNDINFFFGLTMKTYFKTVNQGQEQV